VGNGVELPSLTSIVQRLTPTKLHGQMMGAVESITALCLAIGLPLGGLLVLLSSPRAAFLVVGLGAMATSAALFRLSRRSFESVARDQARSPLAESDALAPEGTKAETPVP
jgi:predicted MFS family arabinose efflux permease